MRLSPPPGPFRAGFWRSPLRGPWLTSILGSILLVCMSVSAVTGFASHAAYNPSLGRNAIVDRAHDLPLTFDWFAGPSWLYALSQGLHVNVGLFAIPIVLVKLWSVIPRLFAWPPAATPAQAVERASVALLVSSTVLLLATGVLNIQYFYVFRFNFVVVHYYAAVIFVAAFALHVAIKMPVVMRSYRTRGLEPLRASLAETVPEPPDPDGLVAASPAPPTISRRGVLGLAGAASAALVVGNAGASSGGPLRDLAFLSPRRDPRGDGPNDFQVNKTARAANVRPEMMAAGTYALELRGGSRDVSLSRDQLLALPQRTATLPIACVEGWSTFQTWTGIPLAALAALAGAPGASEVRVESLQPKGILREATLSGDQIAAGDAMLALKVNGADLSPDHGFPARIIVPALPGVHNTKWVSRMTFRT